MRMKCIGAEIKMFIVLSLEGVYGVHEQFVVAHIKFICDERKHVFSFYDLYE